MDNIKMYNFNCDWFSDNLTIEHKKSGSWNGDVICDDSNKILGVVVDPKTNEPTYALTGAFVDGLGATVCWFPVDGNETPMWFDVLKNDNGEENTYYGGVSSQDNFVSTLPIGDARISVKELEKSKEKIRNIIDKFEKAKAQIDLDDETHNRAYLASVLRESGIYLSFQLEAAAKTESSKPIPEVFKNSQMS